MHLGDTDGHGVHGRLTVLDDGDQVLCHDCGTAVRSLGVHARRVHGISAQDYRGRHGLAVTQQLTAPTTRARHAEHARTHPGSVAALTEHRNPDRARAAMRTATGQTARRGRRLTDLETHDLQQAHDIAAWALIAHRLILTGVRAAEIARTLDMPRATVHQRLTRHPASITDLIRGLYLSGLSTTRVATIVGLPASTVRCRLLAAGTTLRAPHKLSTGVTIDTAQWRRWYDDGLGVATVADRAGVTVPTALKYLRAAGTTIRPPSRPPAECVINPAQWVSWYDSGLSARAIARQSGSTPPTVLKHLRQAGVKIRSNTPRARAAERSWTGRSTPR